MAATRVIDAITLSVREVADSLGVSEDTVLSWRAGRRSPSEKSLRKVASLADERADQLRGLAVEVRRMASSDD